jgi:hypothetical protein
MIAATKAKEAVARITVRVYALCAREHRFLGACLLSLPPDLDPRWIVGLNLWLCQNGIMHDAV